MQKFINASITIVIVVTLCLVTFSVTYAWFQTAILTDELQNVSESGKLDIIYETGEIITEEDGNLIPSLNKDNGLSATLRIRKSTTSVDALGTISLVIDDVDPELLISGLKWEVYKSGQVEPYSKGTFNERQNGDTIDMVLDCQLTTSDTEFTVYIWLSGDETDNSVMNKNFKAHIVASARSAEANLD